MKITTLRRICQDKSVTNLLNIGKGFRIMASYQLERRCSINSLTEEYLSADRD
jgi:hypothetical protein